MNEIMFDGSQKGQTKAEQSTLFFVLPKDRAKGWVVNGDHIIFLMEVDGVIRFRTGFVSSSSNSHVGVNNVDQVVIWCDQTLNDLADCADDAHEISFDVNDPRLIKLDEATYLREGNNALQWFKDIYPPHTIFIIQKLLQQDDLGLLAEEEQMAAVRNRIYERLNMNFHWWQTHGCPHPVFGKVRHA